MAAATILLDERADDVEKVDRIIALMRAAARDAVAGVCRYLKDHDDMREMADRLWEKFGAAE